ncbi:hypothetical protein RF11_15876 [Thelohanellus kitauei]|uniref:Uncharacterized protein n=1 Tax=Thelohanellus kitauei TaxID=669202 RepID=A0A0C2N1Q7_THEKT|nr:hypothetical protein RF11_15876 [Thelohanellus kitauei]
MSRLNTSHANCRDGVKQGPESQSYEQRQGLAPETVNPMLQGTPCPDALTIRNRELNLIWVLHQNQNMDEVVTVKCLRMEDRALKRIESEVVIMMNSRGTD